MDAEITRLACLLYRAYHGCDYGAQGDEEFLARFSPLIRRRWTRTALAAHEDRILAAAHRTPSSPAEGTGKGGAK